MFSAARFQFMCCFIPSILVISASIPQDFDVDSNETIDLRNSLIFADETETRSEGRCTLQPVTPEGVARRGECTPLSQCPELLPFIKGPRPNIRYLRSALCRVVGAVPYICCPVALTPPPRPTFNTAFPTQPPTFLAPSNPPPAVFPDPRKLECGLFDSDRIVGGFKAALGAWPWMVLLFAQVRTRPQPVPICGGSLINNNFVLTAAHCVVDMPLVYVRIGEHDLRTDPDCDRAGPCRDPIMNVPIAKTIPHPRYITKPVAKNDIALIRLAHDIDFLQVSAFPVCLPFDPRDIGGSGDVALQGKKATVTGWGRTETFESSRSSGSEVLQELPVPILSLEQCTAYPLYQKLGLGEEHLCAGAQKGRDSCSGDSGGPLVIRGRGDPYFQIGVVSFGTKLCGLNEIPGVYARVTTYLDWIREVVESG